MSSSVTDDLLDELLRSAQRIKSARREDSNDYLTRLAERTRREDTALRRKYPFDNIDPDDGARLLRVLRTIWPLDVFDEDNIRWIAPGRPELMAALAPLAPARPRRRGGELSLSIADGPRIRAWLLNLVDREVDGARLDVRPDGWLAFESAGRLS